MLSVMFYIYNSCVCKLNLLISDLLYIHVQVNRNKADVNENIYKLFCLNTALYLLIAQQNNYVVIIVISQESLR